MTLVPSTEFLKKECNFYISSFDHVQGLHGRILKKVFCPQYPVVLTLGMVKIAKRTSWPRKDIFTWIKLVLKKQ